MYIRVGGCVCAGMGRRHREGGEEGREQGGLGVEELNGPGNEG